MLRFSFSTVYMAVLSSNLLLILLTCCFKNSKIMLNIGYRLLACFAGLILLRSLLPFEFTFTKTIRLPKGISMFLLEIRKPLMYLNGEPVTIWSFLIIIWIIGFVIKLFGYIRQQQKSRYYIQSHQLDVTTQEPYQEILQDICAKKGRKNVFRVFHVEGLSVPLLYGTLSPSILLPANMKLSEENLYYVLSHEVSHHFHHDLFIKHAIRLIAMIYWWNPFCHILVKQTDAILEMRVDDIVTASNTDTIRNYLNCVIELAEANINNSAISKDAAIALIPTEDGELTKRFKMLITSPAKKNHFVNVLLLLIMISIHLFSTLYIFEANYIPPEAEETTFAPDASNTYAVLRADGTYDVYSFDIFVENTRTLEFYSEEFPIYTEKEYEEYENKKD